MSTFTSPQTINIIISHTLQLKHNTTKNICLSKGVLRLTVCDATSIKTTQKISNVISRFWLIKKKVEVKNLQAEKNHEPTKSTVVGTGRRDVSVRVTASDRVRQPAAFDGG